LISSLQTRSIAKNVILVSFLNLVVPKPRLSAKEAAEKWAAKYRDQEELYDENIKLKTLLNEVAQDRKALKTQVRKLEEENIKFEKQYEDLLTSACISETAEAHKQHEEFVSLHSLFYSSILAIINV
jgi:septal ring factor EnvC (AmiA/AmiB activator)